MVGAQRSAAAAESSEGNRVHGCTWWDQPVQCRPGTAPGWSRSCLAPKVPVGAVSNDHVRCQAPQHPALTCICILCHSTIAETPMTAAVAAYRRVQDCLECLSCATAWATTYPSQTLPCKSMLLHAHFVCWQWNEERTSSSCCMGNTITPALLFSGYRTAQLWRISM